MRAREQGIWARGASGTFESVSSDPGHVGLVLVFGTIFNVDTSVTITGHPDVSNDPG